MDQALLSATALLQFFTFDLVGGMLTGSLTRFAQVPFKFQNTLSTFNMHHLAVHSVPVFSFPTNPVPAMMLFLAFMMCTDGMAEMHRHGEHLDHLRSQLELSPMLDLSGQVCLGCGLRFLKPQLLEYRN